MAQSNITMFSQQPRGNQFRVGEHLIPNIVAFRNRSEFIQFLKEANQTPRVGGVYHFTVSQLHGHEKYPGAEMMNSPDFPSYISVEGSDARFPEVFFLKDT